MMSENHPYTLMSHYPVALTREDWSTVEGHTMNNDPFSLAMFINAHGGPNHCLTQSTPNCTMLTLACNHEKLDVISALLDMKADPNLKPEGAINTKRYASPLQVAVWKTRDAKVADQNAVDIMHLLLAHGANPLDKWSRFNRATNLNFDTGSILEEALERHPDNICLPLLEMCIGTSMDPNMAKTIEERTSLQVTNTYHLQTAVMLTRLKTCKLLVSKFGANPKAPQSVDMGHSLIMIATTNRIDITTSNGDTTTVPRVISGPVCALLINGGANPFDRYGNSEKTSCWVIKKLHLTKYPGIICAYNAIRNHAKARRFFRTIRGIKLPEEVVYHIGWRLLPKESTIPMADFASYINDQEWKF